VTPTVNGRIQTRIFIVAVIGGLWTLIIGPFLPGIPEGAELGDVYEILAWVLGTVIVLGIGWELIYHGLQQFRWEKDWPTFFGLITAFNEGIVVWLVLRAGLPPAREEIQFFFEERLELSTFLTHFITTWLITFLFVNGPMRVPFIRWRFRGGRLI
jgi:hypothetical protein